MTFEVCRAQFLVFDIVVDSHSVANPDRINPTCQECGSRNHHKEVTKVFS